jgi:RNA polymerase sigma-70 factor (ECF subfamily)
MTGNHDGGVDEDLTLVSQCKEGNVNAFEELVRRHQKRIFSVTFRMIGDYDEACEVTQDAFISAYRNIGDFKGKSKFSTWITAITINLTRNRLKALRSRRQREAFSIDDPKPVEDGELSSEPQAMSPSVLELLEKEDEKKRIQQCIDSLDPYQKEVLILRDVEGYTYEEIRNLLGISEGTVKSRLFRARQAMRVLLKKVGR